MTRAIESQGRPTYADIEALPSNVVGEILGGELVVSPRPAAPHTEAATELGSQLSAAFRRGVAGPGGWRFHVEPELSLGVDPDYDPVVPDLAGWRIEHMPERLLTAQVHQVPDWICEILSPGTQRRDRVLKLPFYARARVPFVWLVDPLSETLEVYELHGASWVLAGSYGGDSVVRAVPFDAVGLELSWLWGRTPPAAAETR